MNRLKVTVVISLITVIIVSGIFFYANSIGEREALTSQSERQGRMQYLIDIRWPGFDFKELFSGSDK